VETQDQVFESSGLS